MAAGKKRATSKRKRAAEKLRRVAHGSTAEIDSKPKMNPFEFRANKRARNAVFGRRIKGAKRNVSVARSEANERRKNTLLLEYKNKNRSNAFIDRRLGERDHGLAAEDKILMRFQRQRAKELQKKSRFALGDGDDNDDGPEALTHMGQTMGAGFDFGEDGRLSDSDDADMDADFTSQMNFGGGFEAVGAGGSGAGGDGDGVANGDVAKTRREVMMDIIKKSKERRHEKRVEKDARDAEMDELDAGLADIQGLLDFRGKKTDGKGSDAEKADRKKALGATPKYDDFDSLAHEMRMATKKAAPTNKLESASDAALREKLRLEALERDRVRRMEGDFGDDVDEDRVTGGDDLDDAYDLDPELLPGGAAGSAAADETDDEAEAAAQAEAERRAEAGEWSSEEDFERDARTARPDGCRARRPKRTPRRRRRTRARARRRRSTRRRRPVARPRSAVGRRAGTPASVPRRTPRGRQVLLSAGVRPGRPRRPPRRRCRTPLRVRPTTLSWKASSHNGSKVPMPTRCLGSPRRFSTAFARATRPTTVAGRTCPSSDGSLASFCGASRRWWRTRSVPRTRKRRRRRARSPTRWVGRAGTSRARSRGRRSGSFWRTSTGSSPRSGRTRVSPAGDLALLRLVPALFSSSDFRHPVATPAMLLLGQILQQCRVRSPRDAAAGLLAAEGLLVARAPRDARRRRPQTFWRRFLPAPLTEATRPGERLRPHGQRPRAGARP